MLLHHHIRECNSCMFHYWFWVCWDRSWTQNYTSLQKCIQFIWKLHKYVICIKELIIIEYSGSQKNEWRSTQNWIPVTVLKIYTVFRLFIVLLYIYSLRPRLRSVQSTRRESRATPCSVTITTRSRRFTVNDWRSYVQSTPKNPRYILFDRFINKISDVMEQNLPCACRVVVQCWCLTIYIYKCICTWRDLCCLNFNAMA